jgi:hypothetical protein
MQLPMVQAGFKVSLSLANLMMIIGMIVSAFQIIMGVDDHHAKERIKNVIIAALLINFSFLIAGFILDVSNVFTNFFLSHVTNDGIAKAFSLGNLANMIQPGGDITTFAGLVTLLPLGLFSIAITGLVLIILIAVFITALVRNLWVAILLTIMPLVWGLWVFPGKVSHYFGEWWDNFIKQGLLVMPTMTFFIYLTVATASSLSANSPVIAAGVPPTTSSGSGFDLILKVMLQMFILGGFLIGGLKISQAAGAAGAAAGQAMAKSVGGAAYRARFRIGKREFGLQKGVQGLAGKGAGALNTLQKIPFIGAAASAFGSNALANKLAGASHADHDIEDFQKSNLSNMNYVQVKNFVPRNQIEAAAKFKQLASMDKLDKFVSDTNKEKGAGEGEKAVLDLIGKYGDATHKHGSELKDVKEIKDFVALNPQLAPSVYGAERKKDPTGAFTETQTEANERVTREAVNKASNAEIGKRDVSIYDTTKDPVGSAGQQQAIWVLNQTVQVPSSVRAVSNHSAEAAAGLEKAVNNRMIQLDTTNGQIVINKTKELLDNEREIRRQRLIDNNPVSNTQLKTAMDARKQLVIDRQTALGAVAAPNQKEMTELYRALEIKDQTINRDTII